MKIRYFIKKNKEIISYKQLDKTNYYNDLIINLMNKKKLSYFDAVKIVKKIIEKDDSIF